MAGLSFLTDGSHEQVVYVTHRAARAARLEALPTDLPPALAAALADRGIAQLFTHQRRVWDLMAAGRNVVVSTGTASGKSLSFALPTLDAFARDPHSRALFLYPTKALAQDQARSLAGLRLPGVVAALYDGDTPRAQRSRIRAERHHPHDEPRHAARRHPAGPRALGRVSASAPLRRARRGSRLPRRVRLARRSGRAPAAPAVRRLRRPAAVRAGLGDHRQPATVRRAARRPALRGGRRQRRAATGADHRPVEPAVPRRRPGRAQERPRRVELRARRDRPRRPASDRLRPHPQGGRARLRLRPPARRRARPGGRRRRHALPGRLHAAAAARHRAAAVRRRAASGGGDERARAGHRRRQSRRLPRHRLSRHHDQPLATLGARGPHRQGLGRARRRSGRPRPVLHARARASPLAGGRGRDRRPHQPAHPRGASLRGRLRTAARRARRGLLRRGRHGASGAACRKRQAAPRPAGALVWSQPHSPAPRVGLRSASAETFVIADGRDGTVLGTIERERVFARHTRGPSTYTWARATSCGTSTSTPRA